jgi:hypothetical protein
VSDAVNTLINMTFTSFDDPISFQTTLEPGQTYTLNAQSHVSSFRMGSSGITIYTPATTTFSFTATVPEPATATLMSFLALPWLMRRRRSGREDGGNSGCIAIIEHQTG